MFGRLTRAINAAVRSCKDVGGWYPWTARRLGRPRRLRCGRSRRSLAAILVDLLAGSVSNSAPGFRSRGVPAGWCRTRPSAAAS